MAKSCIACGKNISLLGVRIPLLGTDDLVICLECFEKMPPILNDLYQKRVYPTKSELLQIKADVVQQLKYSNFNQDTINVVTKFLDGRIAKATDPENSEIGRILKKCPVCKKNVNYDVEICSDCGFAFNVVDAIEYREIAKIYNARLEQIKKNPYYEYECVVVPNLSNGSIDKEKIQEIVANYAMQGWRLVTMYSNELGKEMVEVTVGAIGGGENTTMCEDVLMFERCIKAGE